MTDTSACERCGKPVHLEHDAPCDHGHVACPECGHDAVCIQCDGGVTQPSLIDDMPDAIYHADPIDGGSLSSTFARLLTAHVPAKAIERRRNRKPTKAMNLGKAAHRQALGAGPTLIVWQFDGRTKDGKAERIEYAPYIEAEEVVAVTEAERDQIVGMADALRADPLVRKILDTSRSEVSAFWQEGEFDETRCEGCRCATEHDGDFGSAGHVGECPAHTCRVWCRSRYDLLADDGAYDYKSTQDVSLRGFGKSMGTYGYHQQAEFYMRGLRALGHPAADWPFRFICQETESPYLIQIHQPDEMAMQTAELLNDRAIRIYAEAMATDVWPGYATTEASETASLPGYYYLDNQEALPDEWRLLSDQMVI